VAHDGLGVNDIMVEIRAADKPVEILTNLFIGSSVDSTLVCGTSIDSQDVISFSLLAYVRSMNDVFPTVHVIGAFNLTMW
jgi:hypothetical protein